MPFATPCDACPAPCCRGNRVVVGTLDVYRLHTRLEVPVEEFVTVEKIDGPIRPSHFVLSAQGGAEPTFNRMRLTRVRGPRDGEQRCLFLLEIGGRGKCGVYGMRPGSCRVFPTRLRQGVVSLIAKNDCCPAGAWQTGTMDLEGFRALHRQREAQDVISHALIEAWNARILGEREATTASYLFHYIVNVHRELERRAPVLLEDLPAPTAVWTAPDLQALVDESLRAMGWQRSTTPGAGKPPMAEPA